MNEPRITYQPGRLLVQLLTQILRSAVLWVVLVWSGSIVHAQDSSSTARRIPVLERIEKAIQKQDIPSLMAEAADKVVVRLNETEKLYSRSQARYVLEEFFDENPVRLFRFTEISPPERSQFALGTTEYDGTRTFEIYVRLRKTDIEWFLREIRIREKRPDDPPVYR